MTDLKQTLLLFGVLLAVMAFIPLLHPGSRTDPPQIMQESKSNSSSSAISPVPENIVRPEAPLPESDAASMRDLVLLYDRATDKVLRLSQREYVLGAVCSEMPPSFHPEAIKAQAVAAHSYVLRCREQERQSPTPSLHGAALAIDTSRREGYVSEAAAREMYGDRFDLYYTMMKETVAEVEDEILLYDGQPIVAAYHAISAGHTENASNVWTGSADYLVAVESPGDRLSPGFETTETFTRDEAAARLSEAYPGITLPENPEDWFSDVTRSGSGYITRVRIGETELSGQDLRSLFGLRSSFLSIEYRDNVFVFTATGYGHGVGLSQYGADYMGRQGASYREILAHYYTGASLARLPA